MRSTGSLPYQMIAQALAAGILTGAKTAHIQPSSIDLTLGERCFVMPGSLLPKQGETIEALIARHGGTSHSLEKPLLPKTVYLLKLEEALALPANIHACASNKSSSGRINLRGRLLADGIASFDHLPMGYHGGLWIELIPMSFAVRVHAGDRINQLRLFTGDGRLSAIELQFLYQQEPLLRTTEHAPIPASPLHLGHGLTMTVDLSSQEIIAWKAIPSRENILDTQVFDHDPHRFFEPIHRTETHELLLTPGDFTILATKEGVVIPPTYAAEMIAYDSSKGEFRSHFAGFFDPGFGWREAVAERGTVGVLEVEAYGHPFYLRDGQPICVMAYEHVLAIPDKIYGTDLASNYTHQQGPKLAKWFKS